jgi:hypothetical protein
MKLSTANSVPIRFEDAAATFAEQRRAGIATNTPLKRNNSVYADRVGRKCVNAQPFFVRNILK